MNRLWGMNTKHDTLPSIRTDELSSVHGGGGFLGKLLGFGKALGIGKVLGPGPSAILGLLGKPQQTLDTVKHLLGTSAGGTATPAKANPDGSATAASL